MEVFAKLVEHNFKMSTTKTVVSNTFATADVTPTSDKKKKKKSSGSSSKSKMKEAPTQADGLLSKKADSTRLQHPYPRELVYLRFDFGSVLTKNFQDEELPFFTLPL